MRIVLLVVAACILSAILRIALAWNTVFVDGYVVFNGVDSYYYLRMIDSFVYNFPSLTEYDPYLSFPIGVEYQSSIWVSFIGSIAWLLGNFQYNEQIINNVAAITPAIIGVLIIIPIFYLGKIISTKVGVMAAFIIAVMPGEFMARTMLGSCDHHVIEIFLFAGTICFLGYFFKKPSLIHALLAGFCMSLYALVFMGAAFVYGIYLIALVLITATRARNNTITFNYLFYSSVIVFIPFVTIVLTMPNTLTLTFVAVFVLLIASISILCVYFIFKYSHANIIILSALIVSSMIAYILSAYSLQVQTIIAYIGRFVVWDTGGKIFEGMPLFISLGKFEMGTAWTYFGATLFVSIIALGMLFYPIRKYQNKEFILIFVSSIFSLVAMMAMRRYAYYYAIFISVLTPFFIYSVLPLASMGIIKTQIDKMVMSMKKVIAWTAVITLIFLPIAVTSISLTTIPNPTNMSKAWNDALNWMQNNTAECEWYFLDLLSGDGWHIPINAMKSNVYGVLSHFDYGYWITREARRMSIADPSGNNLTREIVSRDLLSSNGLTNYIYWLSEPKYVLVVKNDISIYKNPAARYIVIDHLMIREKLHSIVYYANLDINLYEDIEVEASGVIEQMRVYLPEFYQTLLARLYLFDGKEIPKTSNITGTLQSSPIYVPALKGYELVYQSQETIDVDGTVLPEIKIFEVKE